MSPPNKESGACSRCSLLHQLSANPTGLKVQKPNERARSSTKEQKVKETL